MSPGTSTPIISGGTGVAQHLLGGDAPGLEDFLVVVDVVQEGIERLDALAQAGLDALPLGGGMMRGTMSKGIRRSAPASSPYTAKVMPTRWNSRSASSRLRAMTSAGIACSHSA
jgi:hypothetical protein